MAYASHTSVPEEKTRAEIEKLVRAAGCEGYASGFDGAAAWVAFRHAVFLSVTAIVALGLSAKGWLTWWMLIILFAVMSAIEYLFLLNEEARR